MFSSCVQINTSPERIPNSEPVPATNIINACGEIQYSENSYAALDSDDVMYVLKLDCNHDRKISVEDNNLIIGIPITELRPQQKAWLTRWKKLAIQAAKKSSANPYLCMHVETLNDPCLNGKSVLGYKPRFTSKIFNLQSQKR